MSLLAARGLTKDFPAHSGSNANSGDLVRLLLGRPVRRTTVLQDVSFSVAPGQSLGIIGENGAGKSTLLKLLTGILKPASGSIETHCRIGALLELGAGFDKELSGRQNIGLSAGLLGWSRADIERREDEIIAFADIGRYIDEPVKHYSTGMVVRLGFAIVAAVRPDLLITDEVLAVGDESFQKKCIRWMEDYLAQGGTLLLVSHSMYHVQKLCTQALWLRNGRVEAYGDVFEVTQAYLVYHERKSVDGEAHGLDASYRGSEYRVTRLRLGDVEGGGPCTVAMGDTLDLEIEVYSPDGREPTLSIGFIRADGTPVYGTTSEIDGARAIQVDPHHAVFRVSLPQLQLLPGSYTLRLHSIDPEGIRVFDTVEAAFTVSGRSREVGLVRLAHAWR